MTHLSGIMAFQVWTTRISRKEVHNTTVRLHAEDNETYFDLPLKGTYKLKGVVSELLAGATEGRRINIQVFSDREASPVEADIQFHGVVLTATPEECLVTCGGLMVRFAPKNGTNTTALINDAALFIAITLL